MYPNSFSQSAQTAFATPGALQVGALMIVVALALWLSGLVVPATLFWISPQTLQMSAVNPATLQVPATSLQV